MKLPKINLDFLKNNRQVVISLSVVILVPVLVILNSYVLLQRSNTVIEKLVQTRATTVAESFNVSILSNSSSENTLVKGVSNYLNLVDYVKKIEVYKKVGDNFVPIGSVVDQTKIIKPGSEEAQIFALTWFGKQVYAKKVKADKYERVTDKKSISSGENLWAVYNPMVSKDGSVIYVTKMLVGTQDIEGYYKDLYIRTVLWTLAIVVVVLAMVLANGQLFQYSILFSKLKEVDQMKDDFISIASHELRTPLTAIKGYLSMILEDMTEGKMKKAEQEEMLNLAMASTDRLNSLVSDILDVSRIEQGRISIEPKKTDIIEITKKVAKTLEGSAEEKGLKLIESYTVGTAKANVDPARLEQVLVNLVGNAIKYSEKGEVEVIVEADAESYKVKIKDTGIGMDEEERRNLFSKFYRIQNEKTAGITGTGLGLWITKEIVERMDGKILVDSIKEVGSEFTVIFPKA